MIIIDAIKHIYPDWKGVVWNNEYGGIKLNEDETRKPTLAELEAVWPVIESERLALKQAEQARITAKLNDISSNLPSWKEIADEYELLITDAQTARDTADIKALATVVIKALRRSKKAERILYWLAKNSAT